MMQIGEREKINNDPIFVDKFVCVYMKLYVPVLDKLWLSKGETLSGKSGLPYHFPTIFAEGCKKRSKRGRTQN